jgi:hypothetical protein
VKGRTGRSTGREKRVSSNSTMSKVLEFESGKDQGNSIYLAGAPWGCSGAKGGIGVATAFNGHHYNSADFFYVTWIVKKPRKNPPSDWACRIIFQVGSPIHDVNEHLNDLKLEVISTFQNSNVCRSLSGKGFRVNPGTMASQGSIMSYKNTTVFTVILDAGHSEDTSDANIKGNIELIHDKVGNQVEAVLAKLKLAKRLEKYFGW